MKHYFPLVSFANGQVLAARGDGEAALQAYTQTEALAREMQMRPLVWQAQAGAAHVLSALDRMAAAEIQREAAAATIDEIAGLFRDAQLQALFRRSALRKLPETHASR